MRTTLDLDDELMDALMARHPGETKTNAVEAAIEGYLGSDAIEWVIGRAGSFEIEDASQDRANDTRYLRWS